MTLLGTAAPVTAQGVLIAPHQIVVQHRERGTAIELYNPGTEPAEVEISTLFGVPVSDSLGNLDLFTPEDPDSTWPTAAGWIQAFPRRLRVAPGQRQTIRLLGRPPAGLADGEYWARLLVTARGGSIPVSGLGDSSGITVGLTMEVRTLLPILYRKGRNTTGLTVGDGAWSVESDSLVLRPALQRTGTAAWLGTIRGALRDGHGTVVRTLTNPIAVYRDLAPRITVPVSGLAAGEYTLELEFATERADLPREVPIRAELVTHRWAVRLP